MIRIVYQPDEGTCEIAALAMLLGCEFYEVFHRAVKLNYFFIKNRVAGLRPNTKIKLINSLYPKLNPKQLKFKDKIGEIESHKIPLPCIAEVNVAATHKTREWNHDIVLDQLNNKLKIFDPELKGYFGVYDDLHKPDLVRTMSVIYLDTPDKRFIYDFNSDKIKFDYFKEV